MEETKHRQLQKVSIEDKKKQNFVEITKRLCDLADFLDKRSGSSSTSSVHSKKKGKKKVVKRKPRNSIEESSNPKFLEIVR